MVDIKWNSLVGDKTVEVGGFVGDLMTISAAHIDKAVQASRLTQDQAGEVYAAMIPSAFQNGMQFLLQEKLVEAQIAKADLDVEIAAINKILVERQVLQIETNIEISKEMHEAKVNEVTLATARANTQLEDSLLSSDLQRKATEAQTIEIKKASTRADTQLSDSLISADTQRKQIVAQTEEVVKASTRADEQLADSLLTTDKQRVLLDTQEEVETYKLNTMLPKEVEVKERQIIEAETMGTKNRESIDKKDAVSEAQLTLVNAQATEVRKKSARDTAMNTAQIKELERTTSRKDAESAQVVTERTEKWDKQKNIVDDQVFMSSVDKTNKARNVELDIHQKELVAKQLVADTEFNVEKKEIMTHTRKDNIRTKAAEQFAEFLKYMSASDAVPAATDFYNIRVLINDMVKGSEDPDRAPTPLVVRTGFKMGKGPFTLKGTADNDAIYTDDNGKNCNANYEILGATGGGTDDKDRIPIETTVPSEFNGGVVGTIYGATDYTKTK